MADGLCTAKKHLLGHHAYLVLQQIAQLGDHQLVRVLKGGRNVADERGFHLRLQRHVRHKGAEVAWQNGRLPGA